MSAFRFGRITAVVIACGAVAVGVRSVSAGAAPASAPAASQPAPRYRCDGPVYALKNVWSGDKVDHAFVIHNDGTAPLAIMKVEAACGCFVAEDYPREIAPGRSGTIRASLQTARASKSVRKEMEVHTNDPLHPQNTLVMEGPLTPRIEVEPLLGANWGRLAPGDPLVRTVRLTNHFTRPMKLEIQPPDTQPAGDAPAATQPAAMVRQVYLAGYAGSAHPDFTVSLRELEPGKTAELTVTAKPGLREGAHMGQVILKTSFDEEPELMVPCSLFVPPQFEAIPAAFSVFNRPGDADVQTLMLRWNGESPMKILSVETDPPGVETRLKEHEAGRVYYLVVSIPPVRAADSMPAAPGPGSGPAAEAVRTQPATKPASIRIVLKTDLKDRPEIPLVVKPRMLPGRN